MPAAFFRYRLLARAFLSCAPGSATMVGGRAKCFLSSHSVQRRMSPDISMKTSSASVIFGTEESHHRQPQSRETSCFTVLLQNMSVESTCMRKRTLLRPPAGYREPTRCPAVRHVQCGRLGHATEQSCRRDDFFFRHSAFNICCMLRRPALRSNVLCFNIRPTRRRKEMSRTTPHTGQPHLSQSPTSNTTSVWRLTLARPRTW